MRNAWNKRTTKPNLFIDPEERRIFIVLFITDETYVFFVFRDSKWNNNSRVLDKFLAIFSLFFSVSVSVPLLVHGSGTYLVTCLNNRTFAQEYIRTVERPERKKDENGKNIVNWLIVCQFSRSKKLFHTSSLLKSARNSRVINEKSILNG